VDQAEGPEIVYDALRDFSKADPEYLPAVFNVLNCGEGCNIGTGVEHNINRFQTHAAINEGRQDVLDEYSSLKLYEQLLSKYDSTLNHNDFLRRYTPVYVKKFAVTGDSIEKAFEALNKNNEDDRHFDCVACGCDTCEDMARLIAMGFNIPDNCIKKLRDEVVAEHETILEIASSNIKSMDILTKDISDIINKSSDISKLITLLDEAILKYHNISLDVNSISTLINIISLNASIEAARAGDVGRAFAVISDEIQKLATKSKTTVSESESISQEASVSINSIKSMTENITSDIEKAQISISIVYQNLSDILKSSASDAEHQEIFGK
jgi:hypothetical protein